MGIFGYIIVVPAKVGTHRADRTMRDRAHGEMSSGLRRGDEMGVTGSMNARPSKRAG